MKMWRKMTIRVTNYQENEDEDKSCGDDHDQNGDACGQ